MHWGFVPLKVMIYEARSLGICSSYIRTPTLCNPSCLLNWPIATKLLAFTTNVVRTLSIFIPLRCGRPVTPAPALTIWRWEGPQPAIGVRLCPETQTSLSLFPDLNVSSGSPLLFVPGKLAVLISLSSELTLR